jgi:DNA-binding MarR family transcriptional regulator
MSQALLYTLPAQKAFSGQGKLSTYACLMTSSQPSSAPALSGLQLAVLRCVGDASDGSVAGISALAQSRKLPVQDVRAILERLARKGFITKFRIGGRVRYGVSAQGDQALT